jgi:hypothetical protein
MDERDQKAAQYKKEIDARSAELKESSEWGRSEIRRCPQNGCGMAGEHHDGSYTAASLDARQAYRRRAGRFGLRRYRLQLRILKIAKSAKGKI